jgi:hypothetical protein
MQDPSSYFEPVPFPTLTNESSRVLNLVGAKERELVLRDLSLTQTTPQRICGLLSFFSSY